MQLPTDFEDFSNTETVILPFEEELYNLAKQFKYSSFTLSTLYDTCKNKKFKERLFGFAANRLNIDLDELSYTFSIDYSADESDKLNNLLKNQLSRFETLTIEFLFEYIPFNYLIKASDEAWKNNPNISINEFVSGVRPLLNKYILLEIDKVNNVIKTLDTIKNDLQQKEQVKKLSNLQTASLNISNKTILENKIMLSILNHCPRENLESIIKEMIDDNLVYANIFIK